MKTSDPKMKELLSGWRKLQRLLDTGKISTEQAEQILGVLSKHAALSKYLAPKEKSSE